MTAAVSRQYSPSASVSSGASAILRPGELEAAAEISRRHEAVAIVHLLPLARRRPFGEIHIDEWRQRCEDNVTFLFS